MESGSALTVMVRRWRISLVGLTLVLIGVICSLTVVPLTYKATGSEVLIAPPLPAGAAQATGDIGAQNALLGFSDALNVDASILMTVVGDPAERQALRASGATAPYTLDGSVDGVTPLVQVTASSTNAAEAERTVAVVLAETRAVLAQRQASVGAPKSALITTSPLSPPGPASRHWKQRIEYLIIICLVGGLLTYLAAVTQDRLAARRDPASAGGGGQGERSAREEPDVGGNGGPVRGDGWAHGVPARRSTADATPSWGSPLPR